MPAYADVRHKICSGDLLAWSGKGLYGRIIRHWTGETFSHVGVAWVVSGRVFAIEARIGRGVTLTPLSNRRPFHWLPAHAPQWDEAEDFALSQVEKGYSLTDALRAGLGLEPASWNGWQCAEYVREVLSKAGFLLPPRLLATPGAMVTALKEAGASEALVR